ncbi:hypothetical protein L2E82_19595 [Cichorium intybus]|uniref:Uncharacterized protein n=1 Tax=Cichorium intybus TaxID=13427 RepID=A0ACB9FCW4_CICIN|nr:hypothetical protein L2E82_19595 [Cichorium intybus]
MVRKSYRAAETGFTQMQFTIAPITLKIVTRIALVELICRGSCESTKKTKEEQSKATKLSTQDGSILKSTL